MRKAGPGFSEAALKENTDLKVDKVTMQRELAKYKTTKGMLQLPYSKPLPEGLIRKIAKRRLRDVRESGGDGFW